MRTILKQTSGFTLIEIILVLVLIGIIGAVAANRMTNTGVESAGSRAVIKNHVRYAQILAMQSNRVCGVHFKGAVYSIFRNGSTSDTIVLPSHSSTDFPIATVLGTVTEIIYFDTWGRPFTNLGLTTPRTTGGIGSTGITLVTDTGYAQ